MTAPRSMPALAPLLLAALSCATPVAAVAAQGATPPPPAGAAMAGGEMAGAETDYAAMADLVVASPLVIDATIRSASRIKGAEAADVAPGQTRFYVEADVVALVRGGGAIPARIGWLVDVAPDWRGKLPVLKKQRVLAFARAVADRPAQLQLIAPAAQLAWTPARDALARRIAQAANAPDAPPLVTGIRNAFHVPGALPGEGETQIFLKTADDRPAALSILRRPGEQPRWSVALGEIIDDSAAAPPRDTFLWYRLACALPADLPEQSVEALSADDAPIARADYAFVIAQLGACRPAPVVAAPVPGSGV